jgi:tRNA U38,U39,U40 pseudouridine synthase TruA
LVGEAAGEREPGTVARLLSAATYDETSPPAPPHALVLEEVRYPPALYASDAE